MGKLIHRRLRRAPDKALTLELGGKAANIVFEDAALDQAVEGIVNGIYFNQGEVCCAGSRLLVQESICGAAHREAQRRLSTSGSATRSTRTPTSGAINSSRPARHRSRSSWPPESTRARRSTSRRATARERASASAPTVFTNVAQSHRIAKEEIFGPVLSVLTFRTPEEAAREGEQHPVRIVAPASGPRRARASSGWRSDARRGGLGQHLQPLRPDLAVRRLQGVRASGARAGCTACTPRLGSTTPTGTQDDNRRCVGAEARAGALGARAERARSPTSSRGPLLLRPFRSRRGRMGGPREMPSTRSPCASGQRQDRPRLAACDALPIRCARSSGRTWRGVVCRDPSGLRIRRCSKRSPT